MFYPRNIYFIVIKIHYSTPFNVIVLFYDLLNCVEDSIKLRDDVMLILNTYLSYVSKSTLTYFYLVTSLAEGQTRHTAPGDMKHVQSWWASWETQGACVPQGGRDAHEAVA